MRSWEQRPLRTTFGTEARHTGMDAKDSTRRWGKHPHLHAAKWTLQGSCVSKISIPLFFFIAVDLCVGLRSTSCCAHHYGSTPSATCARVSGATYSWARDVSLAACTLCARATKGSPTTLRRQSWVTWRPSARSLKSAARSRASHSRKRHSSKPSASRRSWMARRLRRPLHVMVMYVLFLHPSCKCCQYMKIKI